MNRCDGKNCATKRSFQVLFSAFMLENSVFKCYNIFDIIINESYGRTNIMNIPIFGTKKNFDVKESERFFKERGIR